MINNTSYKILCDNKQQTQLGDLAKKLNDRVKKISENLSQRPPDASLLLLAALELEDELQELQNKIAELEKYSSFTELTDYVEARINKVLKDVQNNPT